MKDSLIKHQDEKINDSADFSSKKFYSSLQQKAYQNKWSRKLYDMLFEAPHKTGTQKISNKTSRYETAFSQYSGMKIGKINIKPLKIYGPELTDTTSKPSTRMEKLANQLHFTTRVNVIQRHLIIEKGDTIDPLKIADNEMIIRKLPFIQDARIIIEKSDSQDVANVLILTKDQLPLGFDARVNDIHSGGIQLWHRNLLGLGHEIENRIPWDTRTNDHIGYQGIYSIQNISGSFVSGQLTFQESFDTKQRRFLLNRPFYSPTAKYAGGFDVEYMKTLISDPNTKKMTPYEYTHYDLWGGKAFLLNNSSYQHNSRSRFIFSIRYKIYNHQQSPEPGPTYLHRYHNREIILGQFAFSRQWFYKSKLIYGYGSTEDIPCGFMTSFTTGHESSQFHKRYYSAISLSNGRLLPFLGYIYNKIEFGAFQRNQEIEQATIRYQGSFFTNLITIKQYHFRPFLRINYTGGINRFSDESISISNRNGIRGLESASLTGQRKTLANAEIVSFTPHSLLGFRMALYTSFDMGFIDINNNLWQHHYSALRFGIRLRNERLVFKTLQFELSWYPKIPGDGTAKYFNFSQEVKRDFGNFTSGPPEIISY